MPTSVTLTSNMAMPVIITVTMTMAMTTESIPEPYPQVSDRNCSYAHQWLCLNTRAGVYQNHLTLTLNRNWNPRRLSPKWALVLAVARVCAAGEELLELGDESLQHRVWVRGLR